MKKWAIKILKNIDMVLMGFLLLNIFVWMTTNVFCRFILHFTLTWSDEFCRVCFIWMTMIAFEYNVRKKNNISMTLVYQRIPRKAQVVISCVTNILAAVAIAVCMPSAVELLVMHRSVYTPALHLSRAFITGPTLICFVLTIVMLIWDDVRMIREYRQEVRQ